LMVYMNKIDKNSGNSKTAAATTETDTYVVLYVCLYQYIMSPMYARVKAALFAAGRVGTHVGLRHASLSRPICRKLRPGARNIYGEIRRSRIHTIHVIHAMLAKIYTASMHETPNRVTRVIVEHTIILIYACNAPARDFSCAARGEAN
jgi:hypothetical protein